MEQIFVGYGFMAGKEQQLGEQPTEQAKTLGSRVQEMAQSLLQKMCVRCGVDSNAFLTRPEVRDAINTAAGQAERSVKMTGSPISDAIQSNLHSWVVEHKTEFIEAFVKQHGDELRGLAARSLGYSSWVSVPEAEQQKINKALPMVAEDFITYPDTYREYDANKMAANLATKLVMVSAERAPPPTVHLAQGERSVDAARLNDPELERLFFQAQELIKDKFKQHLDLLDDRETGGSERANQHFHTYVLIRDNKVVGVLQGWDAPSGQAFTESYSAGEAGALRKLYGYPAGNKPVVVELAGIEREEHKRNGFRELPVKYSQPGLKPGEHAVPLPLAVKGPTEMTGKEIKDLVLRDVLGDLNYNLTIDQLRRNPDFTLLLKSLDALEDGHRYVLKEL